MHNPCEWMQLGVQPGCLKATMDPQIKLFGQTIGVMLSHTDAGADAEVLKPTSASPPWDTAPLSTLDGDRVLLGAENEGVVKELRSARSSSRDGYLQSPNPTELVREYRSPNTGVPLGSSDSEGAHSDELKDQGEGEHSQSGGDDKNLQKPDKVVACPRCDSLDTKFCYYNNYNVNQPRHFCKNCQRYWTAGGTLRNVPVGAGRRKNKHGGLQRDCTDASVNCSIPSDSGDSASQLLSCALGSPTSQKASSLRHSQSKRMAGQGSPMRSPGSSMSFAPDNGNAMSPPYAFHQSGRLPFQTFSHSQGFMTSGGEASAVVSSDSASTLGQRLARFPSGNAFDKDCSRSSLSGQLQDAPNLLPMQIAFNPSILQPESSGIFRSVLPPGSSGWAGNDAQVGFHSGECPHGYHLDLDGKLPVPSSQGVSVTTPVIRNFNVVPTPPPTSTWSSALAPWGTASWGDNAGHVSTPQVSTPQVSTPQVSTPQVSTLLWPGGPPMVTTVSSVGQSPVAVQTSLGKRILPDSCRPEACMWPSKALRTDDSKCFSAWPILGKNQSEMNSSATTLRLFHPKLELAVACETKDSFMNRHFTAVTVARPVPFQVKI